MKINKTKKRHSQKNSIKASLSFLILIILGIVLAFLVKNINKIQDFRSKAALNGTNQLQTAVYTISDLLNQSYQNTKDETTKTTNWIGNSSSVKSSYLGLRFKGSVLSSNVQIIDAKLTVTSSKTLTEKLLLSIYAENNPNPIIYRSGITATYPSKRQLTINYDSFNNYEKKWVKDVNYTISVTKAVKEAVLNGSLNQGWVNLIVKGVSNKSYDFYYIYNNLVFGKEPKLTITYYSSAAVVPTSIPTITKESPTPTKTNTPTTAVPTVKPIVIPPVNTGGFWTPTIGAQWQWQLSTPVDTSVNVPVYDIDGFDNSASVITALHAKGAKVICYFSAGSAENWRSDYSSFPSSVKGKGLDGWAGETWLDIRNWDILGPIMKKRMDMCKSKGFDAIEPDNIDGWDGNNTGFPLTASDQLTYNKNLAAYAHSIGMSIGLKNDVGQISALQPYFDWALNEECFNYDECNGYSAFINAGKAVLNVEYDLNTSQFCSKAISMKFSSMKKNLDLDAPRTPCL